MNDDSKGFITLIKQIFNPEEEKELPSHPEEIKILENIGDYFRKTAREIMVPRTKMVTIERGQTISQAVDLVNSSGYSRIPVQENRKDNIVGTLYAKDLFQYFNASHDALIEEVMRKPYFASYSQPIHQLLLDLQKMHIYLAVVVDEYGGVDGLITIEDIIEELVGDIHDEHDHVKIPSYIRGSKNILMDAYFLLEGFNELYHTNFFKEGVETIGGYVCHRVGKIPEKNDSFSLDGIKFTVEEGDRRHISKLRITLPENK